MSDLRRTSAWGRVQARFWTGPVAHLLGGGLDLLGAVLRYMLDRARERIVPRAR